MATSTIDISLSTSRKAYVEAQVQSGEYATPEAFILDLIDDSRQRRLTAIEDRLDEAMKAEPIPLPLQEIPVGELGVYLREKLNRPR